MQNDGIACGDGLEGVSQSGDWGVEREDEEYFTLCNM